VYDKPYDRKFGIEFEFLLRSIRENGYDSRGTTFRKLLEKNGLGDFNIGFDGSEWEVKTPVLAGPNGFKRVKKFLALMKDMGARVQLDHDGLHVHHDAPEFIGNSEAVVRLVENWYNNQESIMEMVNYIRNRNWACPIWAQGDVSTLKQRVAEFGYEGAMSYFGRKNLNISALQRHGTIEIRLHEGTLNYEEVLSWVRFGQSFIAKALDENDSLGYNPPVELLRKINVTRNASRFITSKVGRNDYSVVSYA